MKQDHVRVEEGHMLNESGKRTCENCLFFKKYEDYEGFFKCLKIDVRESERTLVSIGLRRNEWTYSNDDRQWW